MLVVELVVVEVVVVVVVVDVVVEVAVVVVEEVVHFCSDSNGRTKSSSRIHLRDIIQ